MRPTRTQNLALTTTVASAPSAVLAGHFTVRLATTVDAYVLFHPSAVATLTTGMLVKSNTGGECFTVATGDIVSALTASGTGTLSISELTA